VGLIGLGLSIAAPASAATIRVTTTAEDTSASDPGCSLREAIIAANRATTRGGCPAGSAGAVNTIVLQSGATYVLTQADQPEAGHMDRASWYGPNGLPPIASSIVIEGNGATIERTGSARFRLFFVGADANNPNYVTPGPGSLTLRNVTLSGGLAQGGTSTNGGGGGGAGMGGAIFSQGTVVIDHSTLTANTAQGGEINGSYSTGGGGGIGTDATGYSAGGFGPGTFGGAAGGATGAVRYGGGGGGGFVTTDTGGTATGAVGGNGGGTSTGLGGRGAINSTTAASGGDGSGGGGFGRGTTVAGAAGGAFGVGGDRSNYQFNGSGYDHGGAGGGGVGGGGGYADNTGDGWPDGAGGGFGAGGGSDGGAGGFGGGGGSYGGAGGFGGATTQTADAHGGGGAGMGGAIFNMQGRLTVRDSTFATNSAIGGSDQVADQGKGIGGAVFNMSGTFQASGSTFAGNTGAYYGRQIYNIVYDGATTRAAQTTLRDTIVANGIGSMAWPADVTSDKTTYISPPNQGTATVDVSQFDLVTSTPFAQEQGVVLGTPLSADPRLGALANNGGLTQTMALGSGSPAIDAGDPMCLDVSGVPLGTDQRGVPRPQGKACDLGAFEVALAGTPGPTPTPTPTSTPTPQTTTASFGNRQITLTTPSLRVCTASSKKLAVSLKSTAIAGSKAAKLKFTSAAFYLDKGIRHKRHKTVRLRNGKKKKVIVITYTANATARHVPVTLALKLTGLKTGTHTLTVRLSYKETNITHGHRRTVTVTKTLKAKFLVC